MSIQSRWKILICALTIVLYDVPSLIGQDQSIKARCISSYGNGFDFIEVECNGKQQKLRIDVNHYPQFFDIEGREIKNPRQENELVRFNQNIIIKYRNERIVEIRHTK